ncbi:MAG: hypothetical protein KC414_14030, partial [Romboutsia sp.]|nr:hypothetical protein [Romboutsia sp.]
FDNKISEGNINFTQGKFNIGLETNSNFLNSENPFSLYAKGQVDVVGQEADGSFMIGHKNILNLHINASGRHLNGEANVHLGLYGGQRGIVGAVLSGGADASLLEGDLTVGATLLGITVDVLVGGYVGTANAGGELKGILYNSNTGESEASAKGHAGFGLVGGKAGVKIKSNTDWIINQTKNVINYTKEKANNIKNYVKNKLNNLFK